VLPQLVFDRAPLTLRLGNKTLQLCHAPGHSMDSISVLVREDRVLFAADTLMPIPYFVDGDYQALVKSLHGLQNNAYECIVQGHGEVVLRGEIEAKIQGDLRYLTSVLKYAQAARSKQHPETYLERADVERCGKSRILLGGAAEKLHRGNIRSLYRQLTRDMCEASD
jgi:glyoxylase-like metal-dependent hydrolase (beta-lactamase superfamily II)